MSECIAKLTFSDETDARDYVHQCEASFAAQINQLTEKMLAREELCLLGLGGPSCAGKSTAATHIIRNLQAAGKQNLQVYTLWYYQDRNVGLRGTCLQLYL
jgi:pantothenate kinase-related protein Tda10